MSATFKNAKKKQIQSEVRRLMSEHKGRLQKEVKKIDSPLAKYNDQGQLTCILCKSVVRSEAVWPVHINAKQHKENVELAKKLKQRTNNFTVPLKRPLTPPMEVPNKKVKGILKNSRSTEPSTVQESTNGGGLPDDFFDSSKTNGGATAPILPVIKRGGVEKEVVVIETDETLPEGFFDDPKQDAKARNQEYKDPVEEEWEKFQKEIREADNESAAIIAEDQEEATNDRLIDQIDEQMKKLSKVLDFEKKKATIKLALPNEVTMMEVDEDSNDEEVDDFDEYLDWRSKKSFK